MRLLFSAAGRLMLMPLLVLEHFETVERIAKLLEREEDEQPQNAPLQFSNSR